MPTRHFDRDNRMPDAYWIGNNAAFTCACCDRVLIVSGHLNPHGLHCPRAGCGRSYAYEGIAVISWPDTDEEAAG